MFDRKLRILFLCTGNSCRSQMAEGWAKHIKSDVIECWSAGTKPGNVNPLAIEAMSEAGVDISKHHSKHIDDLPVKEFDYVITLCGDAHESCPMFPGKTNVVHAGFDDPPRLAAGAKNHEEVMEHYRRVRDEIKRFIEALPEYLRVE